jgi:hypothetical protein
MMRGVKALKLYNKAIKRTLKSRETFPLSMVEQACPTLHTPDSVQQGCLTFTLKINIEFLSINKKMCTSVCMVEHDNSQPSTVQPSVIIFT